VAREVRVFPVVELGSIRSRHLDAVVSVLSAEGCQVGVERVGYEFQRGGNEMLRLKPGTAHRGVIELIPEREITDMRGFLKGIDTAVERDPDRV
jgi:hypothetical protein